MASFKEVYGCTIDEHIEQLKKEGKWTDRHEHGHDMIGPHDLRCRRCGMNLNYQIGEEKHDNRWEIIANEN